MGRFPARGASRQLVRCIRWRITGGCNRGGGTGIATNANRESRPGSLKRPTTPGRRQMRPRTLRRIEANHPYRKSLRIRQAPICLTLL